MASKQEKLPVVILCGGMGTRLKEETEFKPKPMVNVGEQPILWHIMKHYGHYSFKDFIFCLGYKGEMIKQYFLNYEYMMYDFTINLGSHRKKSLHDPDKKLDWNVTLADTGLHTNSGARIRMVQKYIQTDTFMATYGDGVSTVDLRELLAFHKRMGKIATLTGVHPASRFGELTIERDLVVLFSEKPQIEGGWINGGFFVFEREIFDYLSGNAMLEREPMERLAQEKQLAIYQHSGFWRCMDTYRDMSLLNSLWESGEAPWKIWE